MGAKQIPVSALTSYEVAADGSQMRLQFLDADFRFERGERDRAGIEQFIVTLETAGGFAASFCGPRECLAGLGRAILDDAADTSDPGTIATRLYS